MQHADTPRFAAPSTRLDDLASYFQPVMDALYEGVALFDGEGRFIYWNRRYADIYTVSSAVIGIGLSFSSFLTQGIEAGQYLDAVGREEAWLAERLAASRAREHLPGDRWVRVRTQPLPGGGGSLRLVSDVTSTQRTDMSFRLLFEANPVPMSVVDAKTLQFLAVNAAAADKYGYPREAFLSMTMVDLAPPEVQAGLKTIMTSNLGGYDGQAVWTHVTAAGERIRIRPYVRPLTYEGRPGLLCAAVDVTESVRIEAELRRARDAAEGAKRASANAFDALHASLGEPLHTARASAEALACVELGPEAGALASVVRAALLTLERSLSSGPEPPLGAS